MEIDLLFFDGMCQPNTQSHKKTKLFGKWKTKKTYKIKQVILSILAKRL